MKHRVHTVGLHDTALSNSTENLLFVFVFLAMCRFTDVSLQCGAF